MDNIIEKFKVDKGKKFSLKDHDPKFTDKYNKQDAALLLSEFKVEMDGLQEKLYAINKHSLLIIFQAMDAAGKDSAIEHTMSGLNPQGCQVYSFKQPSSEELDHDFLWRHYKALPERGRIGIHNRSHYENVLISKEVQKERFLERIDEPMKNWKFSSLDINEREKWDKYMEVYEDAINETSENFAPWYIIPADKKWFTRIAISKIIINTLKSLNFKLPDLADTEKAKLQECKKRLLEEK